MVGAEVECVATALYQPTALGDGRLVDASAGGVLVALLGYMIGDSFTPGIIRLR